MKTSGIDKKIIRVAAALIAILWAYASLSKLGNYDKTLWSMRNQVFPLPVANVLAWLVPVCELALIPLLFLKRTQISGLWASCTLLLMFSFYITFTATGAFGRIPCGCGNLFEKMPDWLHVLFNLSFVALGYKALSLYYGWVPLHKLIYRFIKERRKHPVSE